MCGRLICPRSLVVAQFHKINRAFVFARPHTSNDFVLLRIDLHEGAGPNDGIKRVIIGPNIPVENFLRASLLKQEKWHLAQALKHSVHEIRLPEWKLERQLRCRHISRLQAVSNPVIRTAHLGRDERIELS